MLYTLARERLASDAPLFSNTAEAPSAQHWPIARHSTQIEQLSPDPSPQLELFAAD